MSTQSIDLTIARTIENCTAMTKVLVNLDARRLFSFRDRKPVERNAPMRILDGVFLFDTRVGGLNLRLPGRVFRCPAYPELRADSICRSLDDRVEARAASLDHSKR
jgi:hypothetical protein